jgi:hypothetical protein
MYFVYMCFRVLRLLHAWVRVLRIRVRRRAYVAPGKQNAVHCVILSHRACCSTWTPAGTTVSSRLHVYMGACGGAPSTQRQIIHVQAK